MAGSPRLSVSVVVPAFNEERRIADTLRQLIDYLSARNWEWEVRVVDDGSADETARLVEECSRSCSQVVLQREPHRGKGGAVKAGLLSSQKAFRFLCDADLSMPVAELERFLPPRLTGFDIAIGTREGAGARRVDEPLLRHLSGRVFNAAVQSLAISGIEDTQCGFKMFTARAVDAVFPRVTIDGWAFDIEVLYIARRLGLRILEVPIEWHFRRESQLSLFGDGVKMFSELLRIRARALRGDYDVPKGAIE
jgi:dolichyl-phosphate beta-glucosyltransferase